jgi:hypothetical protein
VSPRWRIQGRQQLEGNTLIDGLEDLEDPESAIFIAVIDGAVHIAYSKDLSDDYDNMLDILETAAKMVLSAQSKDQQSISNVH